MKDGKIIRNITKPFAGNSGGAKKNRNKNVARRLYVLVMRAEGKSLEEISEKTGYY